MKNFRLLLSNGVIAIFVLVSCSKENNISSGEGSGEPGNSHEAKQSILFANITLDSLNHHVFTVPEISQAVLDRGSVNVYAESGSCQSEEWNALPIISSCDSRIDVTAITVGQVEIASTLSGSITMSYRIDIAGN